MAWTITVGGVDITAYVDVESLEVEEVAGQDDYWSAICRFEARDHTGTIAVDEEDVISIVETATTYFAGKVKQVEEDVAGLTKIWRASAVSWGCLLDETVVDYYTIHAGDDDDEEITAMFAQFRADVDASTYISTLEESMPLMALTALTLREAMEDICEVTGGTYWVDYAKALHYVDPAFVAANATGWSTSPDGLTTFGYSNFRRYKASDRLATRFFILGTGDGVSGWVQGASWVAGDPEGVVRDPAVTTADQRNQRGAALLEQYEDPRYTIEIDTTWGGFTVGQQHEFTNATYGLSGATYVTRATWRFLSKAATTRLFHVCLNVESMYEHKWDRQVMAKLGQTSTALIAEMNEWPAATAQNDMLLADATPEWAILTGPDAENEVLVATADPFTPAWRALTLGDVGGIGYATPGLTLGTSNVEGAAATVIRSDATILAFDATAPVTLTVSTAAAAGSASVAARRDHAHAITSSSNPGAAASILASAADGGLQLIRLGVGVDPSTDNGLMMAEDAWIGIGSSTERIAFNGSADQVEVLAADLDIATAGKGIVHADGNTAGYVLRGNGTRYVPGQLAVGDITGGDAQFVVMTATANLANERVLTAGDGLDRTDGGAGGNVTLAVDVTDILGSGLTESSNNIDLNWGTPTIGTIQCDASANAGTSTNPARSDHQHAIACAAPGTNLSVSSSNAEGSGSNFARSTHVHAIDSSSDPGAAASLLATDASGYLHLVRLYADEYVMHEDDTDTYLRFQSDQITLRAGGADMIDVVEGAVDYVNFPAGPVFVNETVNAKMTQGLTINQGAADDEAFAIKSSDVNHGATDLSVETDTYFQITKAAAAAGGALLIGWRDADAANNGAVIVQGFLAENVDTTKSTAGRAISEVHGIQTSGTSYTNTVADGNVFAVRTIRGGTDVTLMIVDEDGDVHYDGSTSAYDDHEDAVLAWDVSRALAGKWDELLHYGKEALLASGVVSGIGEDGRVFLSTKRATMLSLCALGQLWQRVQALEGGRL